MGDDPEAETIEIDGVEYTKESLLDGAERLVGNGRLVTERLRDGEFEDEVEQTHSDADFMFVQHNGRPPILVYEAADRPSEFTHGWTPADEELARYDISPDRFEDPRAWWAERVTVTEE